MKKYLLLLSLLGLVSCSYGDNSQVNITPETPQAKTPYAYETTLENVSSKIKQSKEFQACMNQHVDSCVQAAGMEIARSTKSIDFCKEIGDAEQQEGCIFAVTLMNAQDTYDKSLCNGLSETYKKQCEQSIIRSEAMDKKDISICKQLGSDSTGTTSTGIVDTSRDTCMMNIIVTDNNSTTTACSEIRDPQIRDICTSTVKNRSRLQ